MNLKCKAVNGDLKVGDIVTILSFGNEKRYLYRIVGFQKYNRKNQVLYRKVIPSTLEFFPETVGSWMDFDEVRVEMKIIK